MVNTTLLINRFRGLHLLSKTFPYIDCAKYKNADERKFLKLFKYEAVYFKSTASIRDAF